MGRWPLRSVYSFARAAVAASVRVLGCGRGFGGKQGFIHEIPFCGIHKKKSNRHFIMLFSRTEKPPPHSLLALELPLIVPLFAS
jgi:hypothetical protein